LEQVGRFYGFGGLQRSGRSFVVGAGDRCLRGEADSQDVHISRIKFILSYPVTEVAGSLCLSRVDLVKLVEPVLRPSRIEGASSVNTVILDAGHGGTDNGASGRLGHEKDFTLDVVLRAAELLGRSGYKVLLTRSSNEFVSLEERTKFANRFSSALFISVHFNAGGNGTGVETFAMSPRGVPSMSLEGAELPDVHLYPGNRRDPENAALATASHAALVARSGMLDRGVKRARFYVLRENSLPGVLLEAGFMSNPEDMKKIASPWYRQQVAGGILEGVTNYRRAVGRAAV
jgi:N-acetylmuramoyl-L-alanine amidase